MGWRFLKIIKKTKYTKTGIQNGKTNANKKALVDVAGDEGSVDHLRSEGRDETRWWQGNKHNGIAAYRHGAVVVHDANVVAELMERRPVHGKAIRVVERQQAVVAVHQNNVHVHRAYGVSDNCPVLRALTTATRA